MTARRRIVAAAVLTGTAALLGPAGAHGAAPDTTASRVPVTISAASLSVDRLVYVDTVPVHTAAGNVQTLQIDLEGASFEGLALALPCVPIQIGGLTGKTTTTGTTTADRLTVYATDLVATIGGTQVRLSSTDAAYPPPEAGTVLVSNGTVVEPTMVSVLTVAAVLETSSLRTSAAFCSPGAAKPLTGSPLTVTPTPSAPTTSGGAEPAAPSSSGTGQPAAPGPSTPPQDTASPSAPSGEPSGGATTPSVPDPSPDQAPPPAPTP